MNHLALIGETSVSLKSTKEQLEKLLGDKDNKVIALSGKWGTGKSHMWDEIKKSSDDKNVKMALYASLFGLSSIEQVKTKLLQSAIPSIKAKPHFWKSAKQMYSTGVKTLEGFHKSFGTLNDISLLFAPAMLKDKIIVLDDIERKHEKLNIDEILGFIDELKQPQYESRFLLILNSDQLDQLTVWNTLREKVIDQELRLRTSTKEAFEIAVGINTSSYSTHISTAVEACGVTNIRIICKIIKAVNNILHGRNDLSDAVLSRIIPSTVLLSAIHYKGLNEGPTVEFVLSKGATQDWSHFLAERKQEKEDTPESQRISKWQLLMSKLGIAVSDNFELVVVEYLESGLFDDSEVAKIIDRYIAETDAMNAREACHTFFDRFRWHHQLTHEQLLEEAKQIVTKAFLLDASTVTLLHKLVNELPGGSEVADTAITIWIDAFKAKDHNDMTFRGFYDQSFHPSIIEAFKDAENNMQNNTTALDACVYVTEHNGWGERQKIALNSTSVQSMEEMIRTLEPNNLRRFMFGKFQASCRLKVKILCSYFLLVSNLLGRFVLGFGMIRI